MRWSLDGSHWFTKLIYPKDLIFLKGGYVLFILGGVIALTVAPEAVVRTLPYPAEMLRLTAIGVGLIAGKVTISRLRHWF